jgi:hypothetical protein
MIRHSLSRERLKQPISKPYKTRVLVVVVVVVVGAAAATAIVIVDL